MQDHKLSIDIGGTFVDIVTFDFASQSVKAFKLPTTPDDPARGVIQAIGRLDVPATQVSEFIHGTTLGLNAVLERKGTTVGIITNEGFRDILEIGRGALEFADMYRFDYPQPKSIVERRHIRGVAGRMDDVGDEITPLDEEAVRRAAQELQAEGCKAIAISFLHSYANTAHERRAADIVREVCPDMEVSAGALLANEYREYERTSTAVLDAYIKPVLKNYLDRVSDGIEGEGFDGRKYVMNSSGGMLTFGLAEAQPISTVLSGPAGGVSGALHVSRVTNRPNVISVDVGGTSLDACLIVDHNPVDVFEARIETFPILQPIFDLRTLGAGGGSIARIDNALLRVGPESAGAVPGPACYGRGGTEPTVTDAALILGYIDTTNFMGGEMAVAYDLAAEAMQKAICDPLGLSLEDAARSIFDVLISRTASSVKEMMLEKGLDPRDFAMLGFGGCGPLLGPMLFAELDMAELVVPPLPSVFSAWGMMASDLSFAESASVMLAVGEGNLPDVRTIADDLHARSLAALRERIGADADPEVGFSARLRFVGQEHTLSVAWSPDEDAQILFSRFSEAHKARFGHTFDTEAEITALMVKLVIPAQKPEVSAGLTAPAPGAAEADHRMFDAHAGRMADCRKLRRDALEPGKTYRGPLLITDEGSSLGLRGDQQARVDDYGMISITRIDGEGAQ
ncbi:hydantoinase/oxoprolinase family protein [Oceaniglobus trochenteri]|uniref:hydantoinase/oxoprolinase family protein n=1 Tax=Oceaniglobus trochenteri TaxID=2763260 RepID=UPI001CFFB509|nr:hydantoinase/oxoprolinase family protein [Oceaniglobus trochenteri]